MTRLSSIRGQQIESGISNTLSDEANAKFQQIRHSGCPSAASNKFSLVIPHLPYRELSPNAYKKNWWSKHPYAQSAKQEAYYLAKDKLNGWNAPDKAIINYTFTVKTHRVRDLDNLISSCKSIQDGLVMAGALKKDDCWHLSLGKVEVVLGKQEQILIEILAKS